VANGSNNTRNRLQGRYRPNAPQVIAETIAGEAMIVNLATGHYFSLQGSGVDIWAEIEHERRLSDIVATLELRYAAEEREIATAVEQLIDELEQEKLVVATTEGERASDSAVADATSESALSENGARASAQERPRFVQPALAKFTDMQDIILLDPVHEVDASGWPHAAASS